MRLDFPENVTILARASRSNLGHVQSRKGCLCRHSLSVTTYSKAILLAIGEAAVLPHI